MPLIYGDNTYIFLSEAWLRLNDVYNLDELLQFKAKFL